MEISEILDKRKISELKVPSESDILSSKELESLTAGKKFSDAIVFETSGTTGKPKRIPYSTDILDSQRTHESKAFKIGGINEEDTVMTLAAPLNAISGWASRSGSRKVGAEVLNRSFNDYENVIKWKEAKDVTALFATPLVAKAIGEEIEENFGAPKEVFPNLSKGFMFGDLLPENLKKELKNQWGFEELRSLYGTVEADVIAIEEGKSGKLVPLIDRLVIEILPYEDGTKMNNPVDIRNIDQVKKGSILITDPKREKIDITRYEIGDIVKVYPDRPVPRIEVLGRTDNTINLGGAPLYENELHKAINDTHGPKVNEWKAVASRNNSKPAIDIYVSGEINVKKDELLENLFERAPPVKEAYSDVGEGIIDYIDIHKVEDESSLNEEINSDSIESDVKSERIIFTDSF